MAMKVLVETSQDCEGHWVPSQEQLQQWSEVVIAAASDLSKPVAISLRIVDAKEARELNAKYRDKDYATNVLSFPLHLPLDQPQMDYRPLGDIVICPRILEVEANEQGKPLADHWAHLVIHGILHLLGYDHEDTSSARIMEALEVSSLQKLGINNPYLVG